MHFAKTGRCERAENGICAFLHVVCMNEPNCTFAGCKFGHPSRNVRRHASAGQMTHTGAAGGSRTVPATGGTSVTMTSSSNTTTTTAASTMVEKGRIYAIDCEFITVCSKLPNGAHDMSSSRKCVVSVGIVDEELEVILYARVKKPANTLVLDDSFVRTVGGLSSQNGGWDKGIHVNTVRSLLQNFMREGGVLVGWAIHNDVEALGVSTGSGIGDNSAASSSSSSASSKSKNIIDLAEIFLTHKRRKCQLSEAFRHVFSRQANAHNAGDDAKMTMELYKQWVRDGRKQCIVVPLKWFCVSWANFCKGKDSRYRLLWTVLRPDRMDRATVSVLDMFEKSRGTDDTFSMRFRTSADREAYLHRVMERIRATNEVKLVEPPKQSSDVSRTITYRFDCVTATIRNMDR